MDSLNGLPGLRIITYFLLGGYLPFRSEDPDERLEEVTGAYVVFQERYWENVSREGKCHSFIVRVKLPTVAQLSYLSYGFSNLKQTTVHPQKKH
jgi:hypothetical protein